MRPACKPRAEAVDLPEVGKCHVRSMTMRERSEILNAGADDVSAGTLEFVTAMVVDDKGDPIWDAANWDVWAGKYTDDAIDLFAVIRRVAGLGDAAEKKD